MTVPEEWECEMGLEESIGFKFHNLDIRKEVLPAAGAAVCRKDGDAPADGSEHLALLGYVVLDLTLLGRWYQSRTSTGTLVS